jgi:ribosomal-protein-alanine N-acetyltransferase
MMRFFSSWFAREASHLEPMRPDHLPLVSRIHSLSQDRGWTDGEYASLLAQSNVFGFVARPVDQPRQIQGFVLGRLIDGEAEVLMVAVDPEARRTGLGRALMDETIRKLHGDRATHLFLEVDEINAPAIALYRKLGFREVARRKGYFEHKARGRTAALVMRLDLEQATKRPVSGRDR